MYALQYLLHSLCGGGYYNMRVPNIQSPTDTLTRQERDRLAEEARALSRAAGRVGR